MQWNADDLKTAGGDEMPRNTTMDQQEVAKKDHGQIHANNVYFKIIKLLAYIYSIHSSNTFLVLRDSHGQ